MKWSTIWYGQSISNHLQGFMSQIVNTQALPFRPFKISTGEPEFLYQSLFLWWSLMLLMGKSMGFPHLTMQNFNKAHRLIENPTWSERKQKKKKSRTSRKQKNRCKTNKWGKTQNVYIYTYINPNQQLTKKNYKTQLELTVIPPPKERHRFFFLHFFPPNKPWGEKGAVSFTTPWRPERHPYQSCSFSWAHWNARSAAKDPRGYGWMVDGWNVSFKLMVGCTVIINGFSHEESKCISGGWLKKS